MGDKQLTKDGKERKDRIVTRIFTQRTQTKLIMGLYTSVLPLLKSFVTLFEMKDPLIHQLYEEQVSILIPEILFQLALEMPTNVDGFLLLSYS